MAPLARVCCVLFAFGLAGCHGCAKDRDAPITRDTLVMDGGTRWKLRAELVDVNTFLERGDEALPCPAVEGISISRELTPLEALELLVAARRDPELRDAQVLIGSAEAELLVQPLEMTCKAVADVESATELVTIESEQLARAEETLTKRMTDPRTLGVLHRFGVRTPPVALGPREDDEQLSSLLAAAESPTTPWPPSAEARPLRLDSGQPLRLVTTPYVAHRDRDLASVRWAFPLLASETKMRLFVMKGDPAIAPARLGWRLDARRVRQLRAWHQRYGAEVVFLGGDTIELFVPRRPLEVSELTTLAREQLAFAPDLGQSDDWVIASLVSSLGHRWAFWFD